MEFSTLTDGMIFGIIDNGVLIFGAYTGLELDGWLSSKFKGKSRAGLGAIIGAAIGNLVSDGLGAIGDPSLLPMIGGILVGCMIPMLAIPLIERIIYNRSH
jgi:hypothetical protein